MEPFNVFFSIKSVRNPYLAARNSSILFASNGFGVKRSRSTLILCPKYRAKDVPPARLKSDMAASASNFFRSSRVGPATVSVYSISVLLF